MELSYNNLVIKEAVLWNVLYTNILIQWEFIRLFSIYDIAVVLTLERKISRKRISAHKEHMIYVEKAIKIIHT